MWQHLGYDESLEESRWLEWDENALAADTLLIVVQVNGKVRGKVTVPADADTAAVEAAALADAFDTDVNGLPLSLVLSWYEQKAVAVLLTLLYLGIKNIRIGPSLPAFLTPNLVSILVEKFDLTPISTPDEDLKAILG